MDWTPRPLTRALRPPYVGRVRGPWPLLSASWVALVTTLWLFWAMCVGIVLVMWWMTLLFVAPFALASRALTRRTYDH